MRGFLQGIDHQQRARRLDRAREVAGVFLQGKQPAERGQGVFPAGGARLLEPILEGGIGDRKVFQQIAAVERNRLGKILERGAVAQLAQAVNVAIQAVCRKRHRLARGDQAIVGGLAQRAA